MYSFPETVSNSSWKDGWSPCKEKWNFRELVRIEPKVKSEHLHAGSAFAKGCEAARLAFFRDGKPPDVAVGKGLEALWKEYGEFSPPPESAKSWQGVTNAFVFYFDVWKLDEDYVTPMFFEGESAIEFSFALPIDVLHPTTGNPILFTGKVDWFGQFADSLWVVDEKTTKGIGSSWAEQWPLRAQFIGYCWAARQSGYKVKGAIVRGISIQKTMNKEAEAMPLFNDAVIARWYKSLCSDVEEMKRYWKENYFPKNYGHACTEYGGCDFRVLCTAPNPENFMGLYEERKRRGG